MDFQVVWSRRALGDLKALVQYIARDNRTVAKRFGNLVVSKVDEVIQFPRMGRMVPEYHEDGLREILIPPYRVIYEIDDRRQTIAVLRIWHGARSKLDLDQ